VKILLLLAGCAIAIGCTRHDKDASARDRITVCGAVALQDGAPVSKALIELHKLGSDTADDVIENSYEVSETDQDGRFVFRSAYVSRDYWLSINWTRGCGGLSRSDLESRRLPVTFQRSAPEGGCESKIKLSLDNHCDLKMQ
jgi:hypothetical protein